MLDVELYLKDVGKRIMERRKNLMKIAAALGVSTCGGDHRRMHRLIS